MFLTTAKSELSRAVNLRRENKTTVSMSIPPSSLLHRILRPFADKGTSLSVRGANLGLGIITPKGLPNAIIDPVSQITDNMWRGSYTYIEHLNRADCNADNACPITRIVRYPAPRSEDTCFPSRLT